MRLYIKAALPCSVHTGSSHTLYFLASTIMRLYIKAAFPCSVHSGSSHTLYFLASIIMHNYAFYIKAALPCSVHSGSSHTLYFLASIIMRLYIKAALPCSVHTGSSHTLYSVQLCVYTGFLHIQAIHIRCTSLLVQLCVLHQSRTSLLSAYRLFTYAVPPCWYNYAFYIKAALPCSVHTGLQYLLAGTIMRIKAALPCFSASHTLLAGTIMRIPCSVHTGSPLCVYTSKPHFLAQCIQALHICCTSLLV